MHPYADKLREECGIFGIWGNNKASFHTARGLFSLQHRGQEGAGIVTYSDHDGFLAHRGPGLVSDNFPPEKLKSLRGRAAIGHVRYSTAGATGPKALENIQPLFAETAYGMLAIAHNGNLTNADVIRQKMISSGHIFHASSDTAVILHLSAHDHGNTRIEQIVDGLKKVTGSYALVLLTDTELIGIRDPYGVRPLVLGKQNRSFVLSSETCALDAIGAKFIREVEPGEMVIISDKGLRSLKPFPKKERRACDFEDIYFARPDSIIDGRSVSETRNHFGRILAIEAPAKADIVLPVPDSGMSAALGFSEASGIPFSVAGLVRNHYVGRTFIDPAQATRAVRVRLKLNANRAVVKGKKVVLVDDSIVRGTTIKEIVRMLRRAGAKEIHLRISCPQIKFSCHYGIDTPSRKKLLASNFKTVEGMRRYLGVNSLYFLSIDGLHSVIGDKKHGKCCGQCSACFTGNYFT